MWKDYSSGYLKNNRASCLSVMIAAFISALLLSLLCSLFYNLWNYEVERIKVEEGGWQGRIAGTIGMEEIERIRNYANVEKALINEDLSDEQEIVVDVYLKKIKNVFRDMAEIAELAGLSEEAVTYHYELLNLYLVRDSRDSALRWVFPFALLLFPDIGHSQCVCGDDEFQNSSVRYSGEYRSHTEADSGLSSAGSVCLVRGADCCGQHLRYPAQHGNCFRNECDTGGCWKTDGTAFPISSCDLVSFSRGIGTDRVYFRMDSCEETEQTDAA